LYSLGITYIKYSILYVKYISMMEFQRKKKIRRILYSPITLIILAIIFIIILKATWGVYKKEYISSENLDKEKVELAKLQSRQKDLAQAISYLNTDEGVENEIRTKFRAVKEGENLAVIIDAIATRTPEKASTTRGFWYNLFH